MSKTIPILVLFVISLYGYRIEGHLFDNTDETRLQGVTVKLYKDANADALPDDGDTFISSTVSDENGTFLFDERYLFPGRRFQNDRRLSPDLDGTDLCSRRGMV